MINGSREWAVHGINSGGASWLDGGIVETRDPETRSLLWQRRLMGRATANMKLVSELEHSMFSIET